MISNKLRNVHAVKANAKRLKKVLVCFRCGTNQNLTIHHQFRVKEAKELPREQAVAILANPENSMILCLDCHKKLHDLMKSFLKKEKRSTKKQRDYIYNGKTVYPTAACRKREIKEG